MTAVEIGSFLKKLRTEKGITQRNLAKDIGITHQAISRWENGKSIPDIDVLRILSEYYNISVDEILKATENSKKPRSGNYIGLVLVSIFIILELFFVFQYFLFERHIITTIISTILTSTTLIVGLLFIPKKYYQIFLLLLTIGVFAYVNIANSTNGAYYDLNYMPRFIEVNRTDISLGGDGEVMVEDFYYNDTHYVVGWQESSSSLLIYDLSKSFEDFESLIVLDGYEIYDVVCAIDGLYVSAQIENTATMESMIIRVDVNTGLYEVLNGTETNGYPYNLILVNQFLYYIPNSFGKNLYTYRYENNESYLEHSFTEDVYDIVANIDGYTVSYCEEGTCNVYEASLNYSKLFYYFDESLPSQLYLQKGYEKVIAFSLGANYFLYPDGIVEEQNVNYYFTNEHDYEIINTSLYEQGKMLSDYTYVTEEYQVEPSPNLFFDNNLGYVIFGERNLIQVEFYPYEISSFQFSSDIREIMIFGAIFSALIINGFSMLLTIYNKRKQLESH